MVLDQIDQQINFVRLDRTNTLSIVEQVSIEDVNEQNEILGTSHAIVRNLESFLETFQNSLALLDGFSVKHVGARSDSQSLVGLFEQFRTVLSRVGSQSIDVIFIEYGQSAQCSNDEADGSKLSFGIRKFVLEQHERFSCQIVGSLLILSFSINLIHTQDTFQIEVQSQFRVVGAKLTGNFGIHLKDHLNGHITLLLSHTEEATEPDYGNQHRRIGEFNSPDSTLRELLIHELEHTKVFGAVFIVYQVAHGSQALLFILKLVVFSFNIVLFFLQQRADELEELLYNF
mmetsp:Transcript_54426/g.62366  ORF Transcript_54426/g.62366 Transcript_54426/m.62366 type:complete len:287 (-) Transcript_54426:1409-2269(-)